MSSSSIENATLDAASVRSSLARIMFDAIHHRSEPLSFARWCQWHEWLFPEPNTLLSHINVGALRGEAPMPVVSGRLDRPTVRFEAPPRDILPALLDGFVDWFNHSADDATLDPLLRAAITHF